MAAEGGGGRENYRTPVKDREPWGQGLSAQGQGEKQTTTVVWQGELEAEEVQWAAGMQSETKYISHWQVAVAQWVSLCPQLDI